MIGFPFKRVFGLIGGMRVGKNEVANFLTETRGFEQLAFADQVKDEFGISKCDFEAAKIAGNIEELRNKLWSFSAEKKKNDPEYFIKKVIKRAMDSNKSVVITDIRTPEEFNALLSIKNSRIYWVHDSSFNGGEFDENHLLSGSKLPEKMIVDYACLEEIKYKIESIFNNKSGLYSFYKYLDKFFFMEDTKDILGEPDIKTLSIYINQFDIRLKGS